MEQTSGKYQIEYDSFTTKSYPEKQEDISRVHVKNEDRAPAGIQTYREAGPKPTTRHKKNARSFVIESTSRERPETGRNVRGTAHACSTSNRNGSPVIQARVNFDWTKLS